MVQLVKTASPIINQFAAGSKPDRGKRPTARGSQMMPGLAGKRGAPGEREGGSWFALDRSHARGGELIYDRGCSFYQLHHKYTGRVVRVLIRSDVLVLPISEQDDAKSSGPHLAQQHSIVPSLRNTD